MAPDAPTIPPAAEQRLRELAAAPGGLFTSTLSAPAWALVDGDGLEPVAQVMGSSVYHVGWQNQWFGSSWRAQGRTEELTVLSEAWNDSRSRALARLEQEARLVGAHVVVDVTMRRGDHDWAPDAVEWVVTGTAVRRRGAPPTGEPVLTDLSAADLHLLERAGYEPVGIAAASTVVYVVAGQRTRNVMQGGIFGGGWANTELADYTQGVYDARERALGHVTAQARTLDAHGVVGVQIEQQQRIRRVGSESNERDDLVVTFHIVGTAIRERRDAGVPLGVLPVLSLGPEAP